MTTTQDLCPGVSSHSVSTRKLRVLATVQHLFPQSARDGNSQPRLARAPTIATWPRRAVGANAVRPWPARSDEPSQRASTGARSNRSSLRTVISAWPVTNTAISLTSSLAPSVSGWVTADALRNRCVAYRSNLGRCDSPTASSMASSCCPELLVDHVGVTDGGAAQLQPHYRPRVGQVLGDVGDREVAQQAGAVEAGPGVGPRGWIRSRLRLRRGRRPGWWSSGRDGLGTGGGDPTRDTDRRGHGQDGCLPQSHHNGTPPRER